jgi:hypothetical protein
VLRRADAYSRACVYTNALKGDGEGLERRRLADWRSYFVNPIEIAVQSRLRHYLIAQELSKLALPIRLRAENRHIAGQNRNVP